MKTFVHTLIIMATLALGSVALADTKTRVITGRVVELGAGWVDVQSGKKRLTIETLGINDVVAKVGDTVTVHYYATGLHARYDPKYEATKIEVKAAGGSKK